MQVLPREFLIELACKYELSPEQQEAFIGRFTSNKSELSVAEALHISENAFRTRMTGVYSKFSIGGKGPGKFHKLHNFLAKEYQKSNSSSIPDVLKVDLNIDALVQEVRQHYHDRIQHQCGKMLLVNKLEVDLDYLCVDINILKDIPSQRYSNIFEKTRNFDPTSDDHEHFYLGKERYQRVPGLEVVEAHCKLLVLGKPGSGKTTFLQYVAINCDQGRLQSDRVPIFIKLFRYAEDTKENKLSLLNYIDREFCIQGIDHPQAAEILLQQGKCLILLDGLDEVPEVDSQEVLKRVRQFCDCYHKNSIIITCRINAQAYKFDSFTQVEVADFNQVQIEAFAQKWFMAVAKGDKKAGEAKKEEFIEKLQENRRIFDLAVTPILLNLTCLVFEDMGDFPSSRAKLYQQGLDILLRKWDEFRGIQRHELYGGLDLEDKKKLLNHVAAITFEKNLYFFEQDEIERYITDYFSNLPNTKTERSQQYSEAVLKLIESQHGLLIERAQGIYSFSHLTFHEYFTARETVFGTQPLEKALSNLVSHITEIRWREVFLLAVGMLPSVDHLLPLMKKRIDAIILDDKLQQFLIWVRQKEISVEVSYKSATIRALYFTQELEIVFHSLIDKFDDTDLASKIDSVLKRDLEEFNDCEYFTNPDLHTDGFLSEILTRALRLCKGTPHEFDAVSIRHEIPMAFCEATDEIVQLLEELENQLRVPAIDKENKWNVEKENKWWKVNGSAWADTLRAGMIKHRNIGYDWQFSKQQKELLEQYYYANKLLVDCLNSDCYVSRKVRSQIEDTLLLPIAEIERRKGEFV